MKNPEEVTRIEMVARVETALAIGRDALLRAPVQYAVPYDHPLAKACEEAMLAIIKAQALAESTLKRLRR